MPNRTTLARPAFSPRNSTPLYSLLFTKSRIDDALPSSFLLARDAGPPSSFLASRVLLPRKLIKTKGTLGGLLIPSPPIKSSSLVYGIY
jgi:hypothetical protein